MVSPGPAWKLKERVVGLLEACLDPTADVKLDVRLPELATGTLRQCDVVLYTGPDWRRSMSIVEVQKRKKKVDVAVLQSWVLKMERLGANRLICVSESGYTDGAVREVRDHQGPRVHLLTLRPGEQQDWPIGVLNQSVCGYIPVVDCDHTDPHAIQMFLEDVGAAERPTAGSVSVAGGERVFKDANDCRWSLRELIANHVWNDGAFDPDYASLTPDVSICQVLEIDGKSMGLTVVVDSFEYHVSTLVVRVSITKCVSWLPLVFSAYRPEDDGGLLAWVAECSGALGDEEICFTFVLVPAARGGWTVVRGVRHGASAPGVFCIDGVPLDLMDGFIGEE